jgi:two-component system sensor histidine kinase QseC
LKNNKIYSIKTRLTVSVILLSLLFTVVSLFFSYSSSQHEILEVYDARLKQTAQMLLATLPKNSSIDSQHHGDQLKHWEVGVGEYMMRHVYTKEDNSYEENLAIKLYHDSELVWRSDENLSDFSPTVGADGFGYIVEDGETWRYYQLSSDVSPSTINDYILVGERQSIRYEMTVELALSTAIPQLIVLPCLALVMFFLIDLHFRPLTELKRAIRSRGANKLDRIDIEHPTMELSPLVGALNHLLEELESAWKREKRFTQTAAHELKTPLTILRLNAENALNSRNDRELQADLNNILLGIDRSDRLVHQLLTLARVESLQSLNPSQVSMMALLQRVIADLAPLVLKNEQDISLVGQEITLLADDTLLTIMFSNLIDNAIRYSGIGSTICVETQSYGSTIQITVKDNGPVISNEIGDKLFERFYRSKTNVGDGVGLGLSITQDIAHLHGGQVELLPRIDDWNTFLVIIL